MSIGQIRLRRDLPNLQNTVFGWIVSGKTTNSTSHEAICGVCTHDDTKLEHEVTKFWRLEEAECTKPGMTAAEVDCENYFNQTVTRNSEGRFIVKLPFARDTTHLGESKDIALRRFYSLERKLMKDTELRNQYNEFMKQYENLGHMQEISLNDIPKPHYFLPHHCVVKPESTSTKLRVVFDASAKTSSNISLNEILHTGPTIQEELFSILLRFRLPRFVVTADIEKMYRQILVDPSDRRYQMILWRDHPDQPIKHYQLCTVTYGTRPAPYLATKCLQRLATQHSDQYPLATRALTKNFYVDDVMTGANTIREALDIQGQLTQLMHSAGFKLRKWCANHSTLLQTIPQEDHALQLTVHDEDDCSIKTLGLTWLPRADEFRVTTYWKENERVTKRRVLSDIAHLFDPLGIMSPVVVTAKIFLQKLWKLKLDWDASLPAELHTTWIRFRQELRILNDIPIPRHVFSAQVPKSTQLHAFCDASERAYGGAVYIRSILQDGTIIVRLLCSRSRVAPTNTTTLPRLELCAAKLTAQLAYRVRKDVNWTGPCQYWTDSEIVLAWLNAPSSSFHTFVANRVAAIHEITNVNEWRHVPSKDNPADLVSRGVSPAKLKDSLVWFYGPLFLHKPEHAWPVKNIDVDVALEKRHSKTTLAVVSSTGIIDSIDHRNSFSHLQRVLAYVLRFIRSCRQKNPTFRAKSQLTVRELDDALHVIIKEAQSQGFSDDLRNLQRTGHVEVGSSLSSLNPFLDDQGILRVGGRLENSQLPYDSKHPMLLPYSHTMTRLLMTHLHLTNLHAGAKTLLSLVRQKFWPVKGKITARSIVEKCVRCSKFRPKMLGQMMGNLPADRVQPARPFINAGVDFCGPFWTHFKIRGKRPQKTYVAIFCCFATKAVHIEVVSDLSTDAFIGALKRFIGRRGGCRNIYCDNATNFVGANNQLRELQETIYARSPEEKITKFCAHKKIDFHFIPPRAPHFGGLWEAAVKSAKHLFQKGISNAALTYEELTTVMVEIEAILNSRPLTPMSTDANDLTALTPGHFLIGEAMTTMADPHAEPLKVNLLQRWKLVSHLKHEFWNRWTKEYLAELQHRYRWKNEGVHVKPGTMVILKEDNVPALSWPLGRILTTIKGRDGLVRVVDVKTAAGVLRRPIHKLAPLPVEASMETPTALPPKTTNSTSSDPDATKRKEDTTSTTDSGPSTSKRSRTVGSPASLFLFTCLILPIFGHCQVKITPFPTQPGIYYEGLGSTHLVTNEWNLVVYYDMKQYWEEFYTIGLGVNAIKEVCKLKEDTRICNQTVNQFKSIMEQITNNHQLLTSDRTPRYKRGALDIVGNLANSLFGILDSKYAEQMAATIDEARENDKHLLNLIKNQTSLIDSTINVMQKSSDEITRELSNFEQHLRITIA